MAAEYLYEKTIPRSRLIRFIDDHHEEYPLSSVDAVEKEGQFIGLKISIKSTESFFAEVGFENDDVILAINGVALKAFEDAGNFFMQAKTDLDKMWFHIERGGEEKSFGFNIN